MLLHFSGRITESFDREFRCLYADSQVVDRFHNPDDDDVQYYPPLPQTNFGLDYLHDRANRGNPSEHSSSQSSNSANSIKVGPGKTATVYKVSQDRQEAGIGQKMPERRMGQSPVTSPVLTSMGHLMRGSPTGSGNSIMHERPSIGPTANMEWAKPGTTEFLRANLGPINKFQALGLYDHKVGGNYFNSSVRTTPSALPAENKFSPKQNGTGNLFNKFTDLFSATNKDRDPYNFKRSPPHSTAYGGPDLSQNEPESKQVLPPPAPLPRDDHRIKRGDEKRMTLGHSKLDLVNQYNKRTKPVYSRFELKSSN